VSRALALAALTLAMGGCGGAGAGKAQTPSASSQPPDGPQLPQPTSSRRCDAPSLAWLVGHPRTDIPVPVDPSRRRVYCSACTVTEDYDPQRTNIIFDARSGLITAVRCG